MCPLSRCAVAVALAAAVPAWPADPEPQYVSPAGKKYYAQKDEKGAVAEAQKKLDADPKSLEAMLQLGDAYAGIWDHKAATSVYDRAFALFPDKPALYQQRGHRYLSIRRFDKARADLEQAVKLDEKLAGAWYYLGLLRYLDGDFAGAADAYARNVSLTEKFEAALGGVDWQYMSLRRAKRDEAAAALLAKVTPEMKVEGNTQLYFNRLLLYKGVRTEAELLEPRPEDLQLATLSYGIGNWHLWNGRAAEARRCFEQAISTGAWPALAFIAAEVDLKRLAASR